MKVFEIESQWEKSKRDTTDWTFRKRLSDMHRQLLYKRNNLIFDRVEALMKKYPNDIAVGAFPSPYDYDFNEPTGAPFNIQSNPKDFTEIKMHHPIWYEDMRTDEPYDDAHEIWYVRKSKSQLIQFMRTALQQLEMNDRYIRHLYKVYSGETSDFEPIFPRNKSMLSSI